MDRRARGDGGVVVRETYDFALPAGTWRFLLTPAVRGALRRRRFVPAADGSDGGGKRLPWWFPPERPDARAAMVLGLLATLALVLGYLSSLLRQTMTFAADEFGAGTSAQGTAFAAVRIGGVLAILLGMLADRRGRRVVLALAMAASILATLAGALAPGLAFLTATQAVSRGAWVSAGILLVVVAAEEMPAGARAYALSVLALTGSLGAGMVLWVLPVAGIDEHAWRLLYLVPVLFVAPVLRIGRLVPESRRYVRPHRRLPLAGHYRRLALVGGAACLLNIFAAPEAQFLNEFLRNERGMSATGISLFGLAVGTPVGIGVYIGGRLADTRGRRVVGAAGLAVGTVLTAATFGLTGPAMWLSAIAGGIFAAATVPTIGVYGPELFPTSLRGRANGIISTTAMVGAAVGLVAAGRLEDALGSFARALGVLALFPLAIAVLILVWFPETARRELEDINPEDRVASPEPGDPGGDRVADLDVGAP
ncbi:MAG TPA: MFS transporter [Acidimicrobiales bacterium]|nr:MFS transporter [Acidimicrobiales bacterium]